MSVSPFQVRDCMYAWATSFLEQCKEWQLCVQFVCTYMESLLPSFLPSFLRCPELHDNHSKVLFACDFSRDQNECVPLCGRILREPGNKAIEVS